MSRAGKQVTDQDNRILQLEQHVKHLQEARRKEELLHSQQAGKRQWRERNLLLGQAAYTLSSLVEGFVFQGQGGLARHLSLTVMAQMAARKTEMGSQPLSSKPAMTAEQRIRWQQVEAKMGAVLPFLDADHVLRELQYYPAHGTPAERAEVSLQQLLSWAGSFDAISVGAVKRYVELLSQFSTRNTPLAPDIDPSLIFQMH